MEFRLFLSFSLALFVLVVSFVIHLVLSNKEISQKAKFFFQVYINEQNQVAAEKLHATKFWVRVCVVITQMNYISLKFMVFILKDKAAHEMVYAFFRVIALKSDFLCFPIDYVLLFWLLLLAVAFVHWCLFLIPALWHNEAASRFVAWDRFELCKTEVILSHRINILYWRLCFVCIDFYTHIYTQQRGPTTQKKTQTQVSESMALFSFSPLHAPGRCR